MWGTEKQSYLFQDILLSHEFLPFTVGFIDHDLQHILSIVRNVYHKKHKVL